MKTSWLLVGLAGLAFAVLLPGAGGKPCFTHYMEHAYSVPIPLEMREQGEYLTPLLEGEPHLLKPPLLWWMILLSYQLFGVSLWAMRLPSVLCGVGSILATWRLGKTLGLDQRKAVTASLMSLNSFGLYGIYRLALIDAPLTFLMIVALDGLGRFLLQRRASGLYQCAAASGLSMMCKWPVAPAVIGLTLIGWLIWERDWRLFKEMRWPLIGALGIVLVIACPWNAVMAARFGNLYWKTVFLGELFTVRFISSQNIPISDFLAECLSALIPWTLIVLAAAWKGRFRQREDRLILLWTVASLLPFLVQKTKTERYILFVIPALIIGALRHFDWSIASHKAAARLTSLLVLISTFVIAGLGFWFHLGPLSSLALLFCGMATAWALAREGDLLLAAFGTSGIFLIAGGFLVPALNASPLPSPEQFAGTGREISIFSKSHSLAYLPVTLKKSLWNLQDDLSGLRLALEQGHAIATDEENLARVQAFIQICTGQEPTLALPWQSLHPIRGQGEPLWTALRERNTDALTTPQMILTSDAPSTSFTPMGTSVPVDQPMLIQPGSYLIYMTVDCPGTIRGFAGFKEIGWVDTRDPSFQTVYTRPLYKRDLLRSRPYIIVWPLIAKTPEKLRTYVYKGPDNPPEMKIQGIWLRPIPMDLAEKLYNNKHP